MSSKKTTPIPGQRSLLVQAAPTPPVPVDTSSSAGAIVKGWVDYTRSHDVRLTQSMIGRWAKVIGEAYQAGIDPALIKTVLAQMLDEGHQGRPSWFPERITTAQHAGRRRRADGLIEHNGMMLHPKTLDALDDVARFEAMDRAREAGHRLELAG